ncbi:MAG TPA: ABC transporter substrate-binding protein [Thermoanaerobaculaceae bacterium]|nr:ABC transporter substrate-binding protein [Thermoanaerobaculaceae bacterium]
MGAKRALLWTSWASRAAALSLAAGALVAMAGCGAKSASRTLTVGIDSPFATLDPHHHNDAYTWSLLSNFYDGLVRFSPEMKLEPALAESWEQLGVDRWRFHLRPGVRFHGGETLTAADVVASFERARRDPRSGIRHHLVGIERMVAEGDLDLLVETDGPRPTLLNRLAFLFVVPRRDAGLGEISRPNGTGPYRVERAVNGQSVTATAFAGWHGMPEIRDVQFVCDSDLHRLFRRFVAGEIDVLRQIPEDQIGELRNWPRLRVEPQPRLAVQLLAVRTSGKGSPAAAALADPRVRRAILLALDRRGWVGEVYRGYAVVASQYVHPVVAGYDPAASVPPFDPDEARRLLREAGYADGFEVELQYADTKTAVMPTIASDLGRVGIRVRLRELPWTELMQRAPGGGSDLTYLAWQCSTGDASDFFNACVHSHSSALGLGAQNYSHFADPEVDRLLEAADREFDAGKRLDLLQEAQRQTLAKLPLLPLTVRWAFLGASDRVEVVCRHDQWLWVAAYRWREPA